MANESKTFREEVNRITRAATDDGRLIELGWLAFKATVIPPNASKAQIEDLQIAFFAGSQHLWASVLSFLEDGKEATVADLRRMTLVHVELREWAASILVRLKERGH